MASRKPVIHGRDHLPLGSDPIPGQPLSSAMPLPDLILSYSPDGFWPFNEPSGAVAHDLSGGGHDLALSQPFGGSPSFAWAQPAGPPGEQSAHMGNWSARRASDLLPTADFSAGVWAHIAAGSSSLATIFGHGDGLHVGSPGWEVYWFGNTFTLALCNGSINPTIPQNNPTSLAGQWHFVGVEYASGVWSLYIDGLQQAAHSSLVLPSSGHQLYFGVDTFSYGSSPFILNGEVSYGFRVQRVGLDWVALDDLGEFPAGTVPVADGDGGTTWDLPNHGVYVNGV